MPLRLEIKKKLNTRTDRVKCVDFHPTEPWVLSALYSGHLLIHNWEEQATVKTIEVCPNTVIRCAKFIGRKEWVICGSDDMTIRIFNYHTMEKIKQFVAHSDFIRYIAVHPSLPLVLTASDDMSTKLWDWSRDWIKVASFEGHLHYVMMCQWNPKDPHIFATASLDRSIKIWGTQVPNSLTNGVISQPHFNLLGHESGVNCIEYAPTNDKPYIVSGGDDHTIRIWDYQTKQCVTILSDHSKALLSATFHPYLPIIISGGEDALVNIWHSTTYRLEASLNYSMGRVWGVAADTTSNAVALATDEGTIVIKLGNDRAVASMQGGKIIMAKSTEIQTVNVKLIDDSLFSDGERLPLSLKDMGACEIFPQTISHHPNGRLIAVCGDGEYVVYTAQALRNKAYGKAVDFIWSSEGHYAVRNESGLITVFHNFKEHIRFKPAFSVEEIFGGRLIGVRSSDFICFYDWQDFRLIRRIDVQATSVYWNDSGISVIIACLDSFFVLRFDIDAVQRTTTGGIKNVGDDDNGVEDAFELEKEISEKVESGVWVGDCFAFTTGRLRLQTLISGLVDTIAFLDRPAWLLGYLPDTNRIYLMDREMSVISYQLHLSFIQYQTAICRRDFIGASRVFSQVPIHLHNKIARFLEAQGHKETALDVTKDPDHKFELARSLGNLELCASVIQEAQKNAPRGELVYRNQWRQLGDLALERGSIALALACFNEAEDYNGLVFVYASIGDLNGLRIVADKAANNGKINVAILASILLRDTDKCIELLLDADRIPEAALFSKTYCPSRLSEIVKLWKKKLIEAKHEAVAEILADPVDNPELFPQFNESLEAEVAFRETSKIQPTSTLLQQTSSIPDPIQDILFHTAPAVSASEKLVNTYLKVDNTPVNDFLPVTPDFSSEDTEEDNQHSSIISDERSYTNHHDIITADDSTLNGLTIDIQQMTLGTDMSNGPETGGTVEDTNIINNTYEDNADDSDTDLLLL